MTVIKYPDGIQNINEPIQVGSDVIHRGQHSTTILKPTDNFPVFEMDATQRRTDHVIIENMMIDGANNGGHGLEIFGNCCEPDQRFARIKLKDLVFVNCDKAIDMTWATSVYLDNVYFIHCNMGAHIKSFSCGIRFNNCYFHDMFEKGIYVEEAEGVYLNGVDFLACNNALVVDWVWTMNVISSYTDMGRGNSIFLKGGREINFYGGYFNTRQPYTFNAALRSEHPAGLTGVTFRDCVFEHGPYYNVCIDDAIRGLNDHILFDNCKFRYGGCKLDFTQYPSGQGNTVIVGPNTNDVMFNYCKWYNCINTPYNHLVVNNPSDIQYQNCKGL